MWYLNRGEDLDMNVEGAWQEGVTGRGVAVTILDDGKNPFKSTTGPDKSTSKTPNLPIAGQSLGSTTLAHPA